LTVAQWSFQYRNPKGKDEGANLASWDLPDARSEHSRDRGGTSPPAQKLSLARYANPVKLVFDMIKEGYTAQQATASAVAGLPAPAAR